MDDPRKLAINEHVKEYIEGNKWNSNRNRRLEWMEHILNANSSISPHVAYMSFLRDGRTREKPIRACMEIFVENGLQWDESRDERGRLPLMCAIYFGSWDDVHVVVDLMLQSNVDWKRHHNCIPEILNFPASGPPVWEKIIHCFDYLTLTFAWKYLWRQRTITPYDWTRSWISLCEDTHGTAANLWVPIHEDFNFIDCMADYPEQIKIKIMQPLERICHSRFDRRAHLNSTLGEIYTGERHNEIFHIVVEFDLGPTSAYDKPVTCRATTGLPPLLPALEWCL